MLNGSKRMGAATVAMIFVAPIILTTEAGATGRFGAYCTETFEESWKDRLPYANTRCGYFVDTLDDTDTKVFYYNLDGKKYFLERDGDHQPNNDSADDVDLLFIHTHGGAFTTPMSSTLAMWNYGTRAYTSEMRLGDSAWWGGGLAILATYACDTLKMNDGNLVNRLAPMLRGGLKIALGSHGNVWSGSLTKWVGADFANELQSRSTLKTAWRLSVESDLVLYQDVAVVATGTDSSDCTSRKDNMKWQNYNQYPFLRDDAIGWTCWSWWDDI